MRMAELYPFGEAVDIGSLMLKHGGGGHKMVGTCQVPYDDADKVLREIVDTLKLK